MKTKTKEGTPEQWAEDWLVKVLGKPTPSHDGVYDLLIFDLLNHHPTFVREVIEVMEGFGYSYSISDLCVSMEGVFQFFIWRKTKNPIKEKILNHNYPLAAIQAAFQTQEIIKIMEGQ